MLSDGSVRSKLELTSIEVQLKIAEVGSDLRVSLRHIL